MASFTDQIPQFNPYIQQLPVEAMVAVGMEKQKRYDEGIQKIQSQIDSIAGFDIAQPAQQKYLQSKLNELGNNLKSVAAGDFSNYQLVNSVSGMTGQIAKDPVVLNAIMSTKLYRKGVEDMNTLIKEGKGSASRTWEFNKKASEWLSSDDINASFNAKYKPYTNYKKNALEIVKSLTGDSTIRDDAFDIKMDKDGKPQLSIKDAMVREKMEGISPEKIQQALLSGLNPDDWEQIELDGRYTYSNTTPEGFVSSLNSSYKNKIDLFTQQKTILENSKMSTSSALEKANIDQKIAQIDKMLNNVQEQYGSVLQLAGEGNVEAAKARLFTNNFLDGFSRSFSYLETSQTYENSPFVQVEQWRENKAMEWKKFTMEFNQSERHHADNIKLREAEIDLKRMEQIGYGGVPTGVDPKDVPTVALEKVIAQTNVISNEIDSKDDQFIKAQGKDKNWLEQQRAAWLKSPNGVDPLISQHFNSTEAARRTVSENKIMINQINNEATRVFGDIYKNIPKNAPNVTYTEASGTKYTYTPKDFVDFNTKLNNYKISTTTPGSPTTMGGGKTTVTYDDEKAKNELTPKEYKLYLIDKNRYLSGNKALSKADLTLYQNMENYRKVVNTPYASELKAKQEWIGNEVKRRLTGFQGVEYTIPTNTSVQKESFAGALTSIANLAESQKGAIAESPDLDVSLLRKIAQSGDARGVLKVVEGTEFSPAMYEVTAVGKDGTTKFRITPEQKRAIFGERFEASPAVQAFRPYQNMMRKFSSPESLFLSTSPEKGETNVANSALGPTDFFNVKSFGVSGNIVSQDGGKTYSLRLNIYDPVTKKLQQNVGYPRMLLEDEVVPLMQGLTDAAIYEILNEKSATKNDLQLLQKASKKPF